MRPAFALLRTGSVILSILAGAQCATADDANLEQTFPHVFATRGCTQEDAPALEIYFTQTPFSGSGEPAPPYIRVEISSSPSEIIETVSLQLIQMRRDPTKPGRIARAEFAEAGRAQIWLSGTIALNEAAPGRQVSGQYDFATPAGRRSGSFSAEYPKGGAVCG
jgi:hypothetical protein